MKARTAFLALVFVVSPSCAREPVPIALGDPCQRCHMTVGDERWGAELITTNGVIRKYDAIECLVLDLAGGAIQPPDIASLWVVPWDAPGTLIRAEEAVYRRSQAVRSPMGAGIAAFRADTNTAAWTQPGDVVLDWAGVLSTVSEASLPRHAHEAGLAR